MNEDSSPSMPNIKEKANSLCPFIPAAVHIACYCVNMNSRKIINAIYYCLENFEECEIYKRLSEEKRYAQGKVLVVDDVAHKTKEVNPQQVIPLDDADFKDF